MTTVIDGTTGVNRVKDDAQVGGDLIFNAPAGRIYGDMSNATPSNRLMFQSSTVNGNTTVSTLPNGTARIAQFVAFGNSDPNNASLVRIAVDENANLALLDSLNVGAGIVRPLSLQTGGVERFRLSATENRIQADFSNSTSSARLLFQTTAVNQFTAVGAVPNGTSLASSFTCFGKADADNASFVNIIADGTVGAEKAILGAGASGTGVFPPLAFYTNFTERFRIVAGANRFQAKFIGNPFSARFAFQSSDVNSTTQLGVMPNGTGSTASFLAFSSGTDPDNCSYIDTGIQGGIRAYIATSHLGSGANLPFEICSADELHFQSANVERVRFANNGDIHINNPSFSAPGNGNTNKGLLFSYVGGANGVIQFIGTDVNCPVYINVNIDSASVSYNRAGVQKGYVWTSTAGCTYASNSDIRLKEDIRPMQGALERLLKIKPSTWKWKEFDQRGEGFIAQELIDVVPAAVSRPNPTEEVPDPMMGVDFGRLTPVLVAAVQELAGKLEAANERIAALEAL